ncbi:MAG TPA: DUF2804 domain-containing protein [Spirochaetales bacterium]|nr:DUF2804 domain-containing protein [Spirochaetales bacterium]HPG85180.1 DUF2804 domain-containing protein [Spirochaetales bacterium]HPM72848.1 DUF2804 domain-containing protein [Spirochaetales bacterium]
MQNEIVSPMDLLDDSGRITREGWARYPYWRYDRAKIRSNALRIKEWDYYSVLSQDGRFGIALTMSDLGYAGLFAICFLDFERRTSHQVDTLSVLPLGRTGFPPVSDEGRISFGDKKLSMTFVYAGGVRTLSFSAPGLKNAEGDTGLEGAIILTQPPELESVNIATSWAENRRAFYYNRKLNCMKASGGFTIGRKRYEFDPAKDFGELDWGRGRWTYKNRWYWGSAAGLAGGVPFGWNIGYGFSDRSPASENAVFYAGKVHKLDEVTFHIDTADYLAPWRFSSSDGRFEMDFSPLVDRSSTMAIGPIKSVQHQVFGEFTGTAILDDGQAIRADRLLGFAEDVLNWW